MSNKTLPNYLHMFEQRLRFILDKLQDQLELPKEKRDKKSLKMMVKEARKMRDLIREVKEEHSAKCPHCGKKI